MSNVRRIFVEKKAGFDIPAQELFRDLKESLSLEGLEGVRIIQRYDVQGISEEEYQKARGIVFSEPTVDTVYDEEIVIDDKDIVFAVEPLPGQYDQRADSAAQCVQLISQKDRPIIVTARVIILSGSLTADEVAKVKAYCINAVEAREAALEKPEDLDLKSEVPADVAKLTDFISWSEERLAAFHKETGLAMSLADLAFCQAYFRDEEDRDPTITEIKVIDTYWSDHCRHTTFSTKITDIAFEDGAFNAPVQEAYKGYQGARDYVYGETDRPMTLMDMACIGTKQLKKQGKVEDLDASDEINACSIVTKADINGKEEDWLVMFKNETHNHPTEIEPFGGAATCLGGAIRDPLSGRSYIYQAMRVTGSGDPRASIDDTLPGKLPQKKITTTAAAGYSSYGNQIGLATGQVQELYHQGYIAKRMEIGAVIAAAPKENVVREKPQKGDVVILVGGRTGRDGCGGATGSSKEHTEESLTTCGAEVQKGNPPTERKIQRLFRNPIVSRMIKRCNDFGAGGVSVSIGELTDGLVIDLDKVPKKYEGLDGTELAISESQERMSCVVDGANAEEFIRYAQEENLEATVVAHVTDDARLEIFWRGNHVVNLSRAFLDTNGVQQQTAVNIAAPSADSYLRNFPKPQTAEETEKEWLALLADLNACSQKGLVERFDSTIGASTVLMPFGGKYQMTPPEGMVAKLPVLSGDTSTATAMTFGCNPHLLSWSPFHGALYAVVESVAKMVALGGRRETIRLTFQEYFEKLGTDTKRWGKPTAALLGGLYAQQQFEIPAIGGKDSMSGTFNDLDVPPTLASFAVNVMPAARAISPEFKAAGNRLALVKARIDDKDMVDFAQLNAIYERVADLIADGKIISASALRFGGVALAATKMALGNRIGAELTVAKEDLFAPLYGSMFVELAPGETVALFDGLDAEIVDAGQTIAEEELRAHGFVLPLEKAEAVWTAPLERIFPTQAKAEDKVPTLALSDKVGKAHSNIHVAKPRVFIPVFPGINCEYDTAKAFENAGALAETFVVKNLTPQAVEESIEAMVRAINKAQILMLPGGFSAGDEPDGSGKFIAAMLRNPRIKEAITELLENRDGLMLGICNGFQALIKLGLVPYGKIVDLTPEMPTLTYNNIGRHVSCMVQTKVVSKLSPWLSGVELGSTHSIAVSHGEGRFVAPQAVIDQLRANGQIATQYVDFDGNPANMIPFNPNGSMEAIEGITSPDGRVLGKMGHSERLGTHVAKNIPGDKDQQIFASGVRYFL